MENRNQTSMRVFLIYTSHVAVFSFVCFNENHFLCLQKEEKKSLPSKPQKKDSYITGVKTCSEFLLLSLSLCRILKKKASEKKPEGVPACEDPCEQD